MDFLIWLEESRLSVAIAGSSLLYPAILAAHGVGMSLVVGLNVAVSLRVLGIAPDLPLAPMTMFAPVMWAGLIVNVITGVLLAMAGATRVLLDPVFFAKLVFVLLAIWNLRVMQRDLLRETDPQVQRPVVAAGVATALVPATRPISRIRNHAIAAIVFWAAAITFGRLMGYTFFRFWN
jgi:hypothetical protein